MTNLFKHYLAAIFVLCINYFAVPVGECSYISHRGSYHGSPALHAGYYGHYAQPMSYQPYSPHYYPSPGTYYNRRHGRWESFPGGGTPVLVDYHKRCSGNYVGVKSHPDQRQYYYVCKPDCVIFGKCQNLEAFNNTKGHCGPYPIPGKLPKCTRAGRFPILSDCTIYYKCDANLNARIYSCPQNSVFSAAESKCVVGNQCTPTEISPGGSFIPEDCEQKFPPCQQNGTFRSPSDCSLYFTCKLQDSGTYLQTRFKCPGETFYDIPKNACLPRNQVHCDCIQVAQLIYPHQPMYPYYQPVFAPPPPHYAHPPPHYPHPPPQYPHPPPLYPDSLEEEEDSEYPTEDSLPCDSEEAKTTTTTTPRPITTSTTTMCPITKTTRDTSPITSTTGESTEASTTEIGTTEEPESTTEVDSELTSTTTQESTTDFTTEAIDTTTSNSEERSVLGDELVLSPDTTSLPTDTTNVETTTLENTTTDTKITQDSTISDSTEMPTTTEETTTDEPTTTEPPATTSTEEATTTEELTTTEEPSTTEELTTTTTLATTTQIIHTTTTTQNPNNSKPVTNPNSTAIAEPCNPANGTIPKLEIKVYEPIDLHIVYCLKSCNKTHEHQFEPKQNDLSNNRAVGIKWIPGDSGKTMRLDTVSR